MGFEPTQLRKLRAKLKPRHIATREIDGRQIRYVEGWHAIAEANRIFGFDGWDRETIECQPVYAKQIGDQYHAAYRARTRIKVHAGGRTVIREGSGAGEARSDSPGQAHELAAKAAETDATKRALVTFGNAFGLSLYATDDRAEAKANPNVPQNDRRANGAATSRQKEIEIRGETERRGQKPSPMPTNQTGNGRPDSDAEPPEGTVRSNGSQPANGLKAALSGSTVLTGQTEPLPSPKSLVRLPGRIDKSQLALNEPVRRRDKEHLRFVAKQKCLICHRNRAQAHHLKFIQPNALGLKPSDEFTVPLCSKHHRELHQSGDERLWWITQKIDPEPVARLLWEKTLQLQAGELETPNHSNTSDIAKADRTGARSRQRRPR